MERVAVFNFLDSLVANNNKDWMDEHRAWYREMKQVLEEIFDPILEEIKMIDPRIVQPNARRAFNRINNNLMFHPGRPVYKDHFGLGFGFGKGLADFYIQIGAYECLVAGGLWHPSTDKLKLLRSEIDYEGDRLTAIMNAPDFKSYELFKEDKLKSAPKGYSGTHEHIDLLKFKSLAVWRNFERQDFLSDEFGHMIVRSYEELLPFLDFINTAIGEEGFIKLD